MPRGRKGPPQDNIDSILLALSRSDDIDPDTLSHYFDRLDEEWADGARDKVLHLLRTNNTAAHSAAVLILSELATDFDLEQLEDLVADPTVSDIAKLSLAPVLKELDSEMADDGIIEYLNDPEAAMYQMQSRLLELVGQSELGVESVLEDVMTMPVERRLGFVSWLGLSHDPRAARLLIPLLENQGSKVTMEVIDAFEQLGTVAANLTIPALNHFIATSSNRQLKQHARAALGRLTMQSVPGLETPPISEIAEQNLTPYEVRVSNIDGSGSQMIMLSWLRPDGLLKGVNVLHQDQWGIKDCYGTDEIDPVRWVELVESMQEQGFGSFKVPLEYGRALIAEARALTKRTRHKLPIAYSIWRPFIEGDEASKKPVSPNLTVAEPLKLTTEVMQLARRGAELYQMSVFTSWLFEPFARIYPFIERYLNSNPPMFGPPFTSRTSRGRKGSAKEQKQSVVLDMLVTNALEEVIDDKWRTLYETRLRRQAALFQLVEHAEDALLVRAVAATLAPDSGISVQDQPFLRTMMRLSIEQGPLRMMAEALDAGNLGSLPLNLFPEE